MSFPAHMRKGMAILDTPVDLPDGTPVLINVDQGASTFWQSKSVEELAREQGVRPIQDAEELAGDWPGEDSVDEFLALLRKVRS